MGACWSPQPPEYKKTSRIRFHCPRVYAGLNLKSSNLCDFFTSCMRQFKIFRICRRAFQVFLTIWTVWTLWLLRHLYQISHWGSHRVIALYLYCLSYSRSSRESSTLVRNQLGFGNRDPGFENSREFVTFFISRFLCFPNKIPGNTRMVSIMLPIWKYYIKYFILYFVNKNSFRPGAGPASKLRGGAISAIFGS